MILLSDRFKDAFKVALAMVITYAIALSMGWEKPFWAGLSVASCSLATSGESINRGLHRVVGTLFAGFATVILIALFPQDRWLFLLSMSAIIALCTYRLSGGSPFFYIWFNAGFNIPILAILGKGLSLNSFEIIILRLQETALGAVVYSLVAVLLWPRRGGVGFENSVYTVCNAQRQLLRHYFGSMTGIQDDIDVERLRTAVTGQLSGLGKRLEGAVYDSDEIWRLRHTWRRCIHELSALSQTLERWRLGFEELKDLNVQRILPGLEAFAAELETRFISVEAMLERQPPLQQPGGVDLQLHRDKLDGLSHFQRAAVLLYRNQLARIDELTKALFECVSEIRDYGSPKPPTRADILTQPPAVIDLDRLAGAVRQTVALWLILLMVIYVPAFPNPVGVVALTNSFAMILTTAPQVPAKVLLLPTLLGAAVAGILYMFIIPHLSGFGELGTIIFAATFLFGFVFYRPQAALAKTMGLCMLVIVIGVENEQNYSFLYFANWFITGILFNLALIVAWRVPISFLPEDRFLALLGRFFRSADFLLSNYPWMASRKASRLFQWRMAFHLQQVNILPQRLQVWGKALSQGSRGATKTNQIQPLTNSLQALSNRMQELLELQFETLPKGLARELLEDMKTWNYGVQETLRLLSSDPAKVKHGAFSFQLEARLVRIEAQVEEILNNVYEASVSDQECESLYRLLGAYRGLSEALIDLVKRVSPIDWLTLREARF